MHFDHQGASRVEHLEAARGGVRANLFGDAVGAEHDDGRAAGFVAVGNFRQLFDKNRALPAQFFHHMAVVHDLVAHVNRRPEQLQRAFDHIDGAVHPGAESARIGQLDIDACRFGH